MTEAVKEETRNTPTVDVDISIEDIAWRAALPDASAVCSAAVRAALQAERPTTNFEVSVLLTDDDAMAVLNSQFRRRHGPTNVLSFANEHPGAAMDARHHLGDIVLARETIAHESDDQGKRLADHVSHLVVHGTMHLIGHDHQTEVGTATMESRETAILAALGIADPYAARET